jgi:hypothetical protein
VPFPMLNIRLALRTLFELRVARNDPMQALRYE